MNTNKMQNKKEKAERLNKNMKELYKDLKFFLNGNVKDREFLRKNTNPTEIHYLASGLSCVRNEELLKSFLKYNKIKEVLK
jgi:hypothetical protein